MARDPREDTARRLTGELDKVVDHDTSELIVYSEFARYDGAPVQDYVPLLVERRVREYLRQQH
jgi:hypothetical protein